MAQPIRSSVLASAAAPSSSGPAVGSTSGSSGRSGGGASVRCGSGAASGSGTAGSMGCRPGSVVMASHVPTSAVFTGQWRSKDDAARAALCCVIAACARGHGGTRRPRRTFSTPGPGPRVPRGATRGRCFAYAHRSPPPNRPEDEQPQRRLVVARAPCLGEEDTGRVRRPMRRRGRRRFTAWPARGFAGDPISLLRLSGLRTPPATAQGPDDASTRLWPSSFVP